ncbi:MAG: DNA repair protein RecO C-terminal domain-containing protein [Angelakisella sp.]
MPDLIACRECGGLPEDGAVLFDPLGGSICCPGVCSAERWAAAAAAGVFAAMRHIIYCDFEKLFQFKLGEENLPVLAHAVEQYLLCQVERILPASYLLQDDLHLKQS